MTRAQAIKELKAKRELSTGMLKPLSISFESFLRYAQLPDAKAKEIIERLVKHYEES